MIDPLTSLAIALCDNPGSYAVLLGSGISRAANIMTGWEIQNDLLRRLAVASGEYAPDDSQAWAWKKYGVELTYSTILAEMGKRPAERRKIIAKYFEPIDGEYGKKPTAAHNVIAELVKRGLVRVIITTNFDPLMEKALSATGIEPAVVDTPSKAAARPLVRDNQCMVLKLHGHYQNDWMLNTDQELSSYKPPMARFLARILEDYGLIVCGWSATYDVALRHAIERAGNQRFSTYWLARQGVLSDEAKNLVNFRKATIANISDADIFFSTLLDRVTALDAFTKCHPMEPAIVVEVIKGHLGDFASRIKFADAMDREARLCLKRCTPSEDELGKPLVVDEIVSAAKKYEANTEGLARSAAVTCCWGTNEQVEFVLFRWHELRVALAAPHGGLSPWLELRQYPAILVGYLMGTACVACTKLTQAARLARELWGNSLYPEAALPPRIFKEIAGSAWFPSNFWVREHLKKFAVDFCCSPERFQRCFDAFEFMIALISGNEGQSLQGYYLNESESMFPYRQLRETIAHLGGAATIAQVIGVTTQAYEQLEARAFDRRWRCF